MLGPHPSSKYYLILLASKSFQWIGERRVYKNIEEKLKTIATSRAQIQEKRSKRVLGPGSALILWSRIWVRR